MLSVNPFAILAETVSPIYMQSFIVLMALLIAIGTVGLSILVLKLKKSN